MYLEPELYSECVIYDINGYAIHPVTKKRTVQLVSKLYITLINFQLK